MSILKYIDRLKRMDNLIRRKATGTPDEFAEKLQLSKSMLMIDLADMKALGAPIQYDSTLKSYVYTCACHWSLDFVADKTELQAVRGGKNTFVETIHSNHIGLTLSNFGLLVFES